MLEFFYKKTRYGEEYLEQIAAIDDRDTQDLQYVQRYERLNEGGWNTTGEALVKFVPSEWTVLPTEQFEVYDFYPKHSYEYNSSHHSDPYVPPKTDPEPTVPVAAPDPSLFPEMAEAAALILKAATEISTKPIYAPDKYGYKDPMEPETIVEWDETLKKYVPVVTTTPKAVESGGPFPIAVLMGLAMGAFLAFR